MLVFFFFFLFKSLIKLQYHGFSQELLALSRTFRKVSTHRFNYFVISILELPARFTNSPHTIVIIISIFYFQFFFLVFFSVCLFIKKGSFGSFVLKYSVKTSLALEWSRPLLFIACTRCHTTPQPSLGRSPHPSACGGPGPAGPPGSCPRPAALRRRCGWPG